MKSSQSELVNSTLVLPKYALASSCWTRKSLMLISFPSAKVYILARMRPYLSKSPASIFTILPSIIPCTISFTFLPNYLQSPLRHSGVSIPASLNMKRVGAPFRYITAFMVSPSVTLLTFARNVLQFSENQGASFTSNRALYSSGVMGCKCDRVTPSGRKPRMAVSTISFLFSKTAAPFLIFFCFLLSGADPVYNQTHLSLRPRSPRQMTYPFMSYL